jgi:hypothetical protein
MKSSSFGQLAGLFSILAGVSGFLYALAFVVISRNMPELGLLLSAIFLLLGGLFGSAAIVALFQRVHESEFGFALWAFVLSLVGALGSVTHGGYDLSNAINPPTQNLPALSNLPNQVDPRGLLTFGLAGIGLFIFVWLMTKEAGFPKGLVILGYISAVLLVFIYLARLVILQPTNPVLLVPVLVEGFIVNPLWYIWLGVSLRRR